MSGEREPPPCDPEVFREGKGVCIFHASTRIAEPWVKKVAAESGQRVDWHFSGGMVNVLFIGDYAKVVAAIDRLRPELDAACQAETKKLYGLESTGAELFRILPEGSHGLYRRGVG